MILNLKRVRHLFLSDPSLFQELIVYKISTSRGGYKMNQTMLGRLLNIKDKHRYDLYIYRFSKENRNDLPIGSVFSLASDEIKRLSSGTRIRLKAAELKKLISPIEPVDNSLSNVIQLFNQTENTKLILEAKSVKLESGSLYLNLSKKYKEIVPDYKIAFIPYICSYISKDGPVLYSAAGIHKSVQKQPLTVNIGRRFIFDVLDISKITVTYT